LCTPPHPPAAVLLCIFSDEAGIDVGLHGHVVGLCRKLDIIYMYIGNADQEYGVTKYLLVLTHEWKAKHHKVQETNFPLKYKDPFNKRTKPYVVI
jgi:hypothetical protein